MINRSLILAAFGAAMVVSAPAAAAQSNYGYGHNAPVRNTQCERQRDDDKLAGGVAGALIGGLIGGAIGNEVADDDDHYRGRRGYRGYRGYRNRYHRGYGHRHRGNKSNDEEVIAGALIGAVIGGIAGSSIAEDSSRPCTVSGSVHSRDYQSGSIPRTTEGLYGGPEIMERRSNYPRTVSTYPTSNGTAGPRTTRTYPTTPSHECRTIYRETRLPDGRVERDPVTACRDGQNGEWQVETDEYQSNDYNGY
ncbi:MAG: hypothetical protein ACRBEQ_11600 [Hyphomonas sp.]